MFLEMLICSFYIVLIAIHMQTGINFKSQLADSQVDLYTTEIDQVLTIFHFNNCVGKVYVQLTGIA